MDIQSISISQFQKRADIPERQAEKAPDTSSVEPVKVWTQDKKISASETEEMVKKLKSVTQAISAEISFSIDRDIDRVIVKVTDTKTKEVLRQIPPEETVVLARRLKELDESGEDAKGVILSKIG